MASLRSLLASHGAGLRKQLSAGQFSPTLGPARSVKEVIMMVVVVVMDIPGLSTLESPWSVMKHR